MRMQYLDRQDCTSTRVFDLFAAGAMQSLILRATEPGEHLDQLAEDAIAYAAAMMTARQAHANLIGFDLEGAHRAYRRRHPEHVATEDGDDETVLG